MMKTKTFLMFLSVVQSQPLSLSSSDHNLVFQDDSQGYLQLEEDVAVNGSLSVSLSFKTGGNDGQLLYMQETSQGHNISLYLSDGGLHLQVPPDTLIVPASEETRKKILYNDNQ